MMDNSQGVTNEPNVNNTGPNVNENHIIRLPLTLEEVSELIHRIFYRKFIQFYSTKVSLFSRTLIELFFLTFGLYFVLWAVIANWVLLSHLPSCLSKYGLSVNHKYVMTTFIISHTNLSEMFNEKTDLYNSSIIKHNENYFYFYQNISGSNCSDIKIDKLYQSVLTSIKDDLKKEIVGLLHYSDDIGLLYSSNAIEMAKNFQIIVIKSNDRCITEYGGVFSSLLKMALSYSDYGMYSLKESASLANSKGFVYNQIDDQYVTFVDLPRSKFAYIVSVSTSTIFTLLILLLLRASKHQLLILLINLIRNNYSSIHISVVHLIFNLLALLGLSTMMIEFFFDLSACVFSMLMAWQADVYFQICCLSTCSKRQWPKFSFPFHYSNHSRFFYLYNCVFYCYCYRNYGRFSTILSIGLCFLLQHSMVFFWNRVELVSNQGNVPLINLVNTQQRNPAATFNRNLISQLFTSSMTSLFGYRVIRTDDMVNPDSNYNADESIDHTQTINNDTNQTINTPITQPFSHNNDIRVSNTNISGNNNATQPTQTNILNDLNQITEEIDRSIAFQNTIDYSLNLNDFHLD